MLVVVLRPAQEERLVVEHEGEKMLLIVKSTPEGRRLKVVIDGPRSFVITREKGDPIGEVSEMPRQRSDDRA